LNAVRSLKKYDSYKHEQKGGVGLPKNLDKSSIPLKKHEHTTSVQVILKTSSSETLCAKLLIKDMDNFMLLIKTMNNFMRLVKNMDNFYV
jgi:hypothetical protein